MSLAEAPLLLLDEPHAALDELGQALQTYQYLRKRVENGEITLPEKARKPSSFGHLKNQTQPS